MQFADDVFAVIPAGGSGTRLWPLSREHYPKFLHPLTGTGRSLLQATLDRLTPAIPPERVYVVTGAAHAVTVGRQLPEVPADNIIVEPSPRDSSAAIALATQVIAGRHPGAIVASFAADHLVGDPDSFRRTVQTAIDGARSGQLMTIGITPTHPETGYGYLECGGPLSPFTVSPVSRFREKPPAELAAEYVKSGHYLWNAGMFVWQSAVFLDELGRRRPDVAEPVAAIAARWDVSDVERDNALTDIWPTVGKVAVDYAVMEPASADGLVSTVPGDFGWSDIGDFETIGATLGRPAAGSLLVEPLGDDPADAASYFVSLDSDNLIVVPSSGRLVAALDVHDLIIVDTEDAVLVCKRDRAQDVKQLIAQLHSRGAGSYT